MINWENKKIIIRANLKFYKKTLKNGSKRYHFKNKIKKKKFLIFQICSMSKTLKIKINYIKIMTDYFNKTVKTNLKIWNFCKQKIKILQIN